MQFWSHLHTTKEVSEGQYLTWHVKSTCRQRHHIQALASNFVQFVLQNMLIIVSNFHTLFKMTPNRYKWSRTDVVSNYKSMERSHWLMTYHAGWMSTHPSLWEDLPRLLHQSQAWSVPASVFIIGAKGDNFLSLNKLL